MSVSPLFLIRLLCYNLEHRTESCADPGRSVRLPQQKGRNPVKHKVQYYETDMMGVAHHANYIHWMEEARIDFMDQIGFPYKRMESEGVFSPVKSMQVNYLKPCTFGDEVEITVTVQGFNGVVITIGYDMRLNGDQVFSGTSEHVFLNRDGKFVRMKRVMPDFCEAIEKRVSPSGL